MEISVLLMLTIILIIMMQMATLALIFIELDMYCQTYTNLYQHLSMAVG